MYVRDLGWIVRDLKREFTDDAIADWLVRPHSTLVGVTPLRWLENRGHAEMVTKASTNDPPIGSHHPNSSTRLVP